MLHGTLVKIKDIDEDDFQTTPVEWETHAMGLPPVELPIEVEIVQARTFKSQAEAIGVHAAGGDAKDLVARRNRLTV